MTSTYILAGDSTHQHYDADGFDAAADDNIYVGQGALVFGFAQTSGTLCNGINLAGTVTMTVDGTVAGSYRGISDEGHDSTSSQITIGRTGLVETTAPLDSGDAIYMVGNIMRLSNAGSVSGEMYVGGNNNVVVNGGYLDGLRQIGVQFVGNGDSVTNTGTILGGSNTSGNLYGAIDYGHDNDASDPADDVLENDGTIGGLLGVTYCSAAVGGTMNITNHGSISATAGPAISARAGQNGGGGAVTSAETLSLTNTGVISMSGIGSAIVAQGDFIDTIDNSGTISATGGDAIVENGTGALEVTNTGHIVGDISFGSDGGTYDGTLGSIDGAILSSGGNNTMLGGAEADIFQLSTGAGGINILHGNGGDDLFSFDFGEGLTKNCVVDGGDGNDTMSFLVGGSITAKLLAHVTSIETVTFESPNSIVLTDAFVASAANHTVTVNGSGLSDTINASKVTTVTNHVIFDAGGGADTMYASGGADTFVYDAVSDSTGKVFDIIHNLNFAKDHIALPDTAAITGIDAAITTGRLDKATFNSDLATATGGGHLGAAHAVLFAPTTGSYAHDTFLVVDLNGTAGYQSGLDLVIQLTGATGTLAPFDFT
ncbi:MAG TPA: bluetail domain-containing putative surface protein [Rhizomicrobium sp.]|jgi:hypothetical protein